MTNVVSEVNHNSHVKPVQGCHLCVDFIPKTCSFKACIDDASELFQGDIPMCRAHYHYMNSYEEEALDQMEEERRHEVISSQEGL